MNQVIMSDGSFSRVNRVFDSKDFNEIQIGINKLVNRNDYVGLF